MLTLLADSYETPVKKKKVGELLIVTPVKTR